MQVDATRVVRGGTATNQPANPWRRGVTTSNREPFFAAPWPAQPLRWLAIVACAALLPVCAFAQTPAPNRARTLFTDLTEAIGGNGHSAGGSSAGSSSGDGQLLAGDPYPLPPGTPTAIRYSVPCRG